MISVIIPTYNRALFLARAIESCLTQSVSDVEVIVVDDGSTDDTQFLLERLVERWGRGRLRYISSGRQGACAARNIGLKAARGEYVQFLDSDDWLAQEKFATQVTQMVEGGLSMTVCDFQAITDGGGPNVIIKNDGPLLARMAAGHSVSISAPLIRRSSIPPNLRWDSELQKNQDVDFMFRYMIGLARHGYTPGVFFYYVQHRGQRITDRYVSGLAWEALALNAIRYWQVNRSTLPVENARFVKAYALYMAELAIWGNDRRSGFRIVLNALVMPGPISMLRVIGILTHPGKLGKLRRIVNELSVFLRRLFRKG